MRLEIRVKGSLLVGGQAHPSLAFDKGTARTGAGCPFIPASALKGLLRHALADLLTADGVSCCPGPFSGRVCSGDDPCPVCRLFGRPGFPGKIRVADAHLLGSDSIRRFTAVCDDGVSRPTGMGYDTRPGVTVSRRTGTAVEDRLFFLETTAAVGEDMLFAAQVEDIAGLTRTEASWLKAAAQAIDAIGAGKSRGLGWVEMTLTEGEAGEPPSVPTVQSADSGGRDSSESEALVELAPLECLRVTRRNPGERFYDTQDYIPGSVVRGAAAAAVVRCLGDGARRDLFLTRAASFSNFYPGRGAIRPPVPVPVTARWCKHHPGFEVNLRRQPQAHGVWDAVLADLVADAVAQAVGVELHVPDDCPQCGGPAVAVGGGYVCGSLHVRPGTQVITKTAIDRRLGTVAEGALYSYECLDAEAEQPEPKRLRYYGLVRAGSAEDLDSLMQAVGQDMVIGGSRSRGFGRCHVRFLEIPPEDHKAALVRFNAKLGELAKRAVDIIGASSEGIAGSSLAETAALAGLTLEISEPPRRSYCCLTLTADVILPDWADPEGTIRSLIPRAAKLERRYIRCGHVSGWNDALGIEKDLVPAILRGSVIVLSFPGDVWSSVLEWADAGRRGIGLRRAEGFGRFSFCDAFHERYAREIRKRGDSVATRDSDRA